MNIDIKKYIQPTIQKTVNTIKKITRHAVFQSIVLGFATTVATLAIAGVILWHYRGNIFAVLARGYLAKEHTSLVASNSPVITPANLIPTSVSSVSGPSSDEENQDSVINVVKQANPAVVSIIISQNVTTCDSYSDGSTDNNGSDNSDGSNGLINPFGDLFGNAFPNIFMQTPVCTKTSTQSQEVGGGSGFIISPSGMIVTNRHVVDMHGATFEVYLNNGKKYSATVLATDPVLDLALIKIDALGLPYLNLGDSDTLQVGQSVIAIGNALGQFKNSVSVGVVSGLSRSVVAGDDATGSSEQLDKVIQTDAAINPGNSGGPLLDLSGNVIGINVAVVQGSENIGFALPINSVKTAIESVEKTGKIIRPYIGIRYVPVTPELQSQNNLSVDYGILIQGGGTANPNELAVIPGSPADKAGLLENDIILEIDGQKIMSDDDFANIIREKNVGDTITLLVLSKGVQKTVTLMLTAAPDTTN